MNSTVLATVVVVVVIAVWVAGAWVRARLAASDEASRQRGHVEIGRRGGRLFGTRVYSSPQWIEFRAQVDAAIDQDIADESAEQDALRRVSAASARAIVARRRKHEVGQAGGR
jgi:hypothetical protein